MAGSHEDSDGPVRWALSLIRPPTCSSSQSLYMASRRYTRTYFSESAQRTGPSESSCDLDGGILESLGRLFNAQLKLLIYPAKDKYTGAVEGMANLKLGQSLHHLFNYLSDRRCIVPVYLSFAG